MAKSHQSQSLRKKRPRRLQKHRRRRSQKKSNLPLSRLRGKRQKAKNRQLPTRLLLHHPQKSPCCHAHEPFQRERSPSLNLIKSSLLLNPGKMPLLVHPCQMPVLLNPSQTLLFLNPSQTPLLLKTSKSPLLLNLSNRTSSLHRHSVISRRPCRKTLKLSSLMILLHLVCHLNISANTSTIKILMSQ